MIIYNYKGDNTMTREEAKQLLPIIQAFADGKIIEISSGYDDWKQDVCPTWQYKASCYRIKPEPEYRPFKNAEECWQEMQKHKPFGWFRSRDKTVPSKYTHIDSIKDDGISVLGNVVNFSFSEMCQNSIFVDGKPFGIREGEVEKIGDIPNSTSQKLVSYNHQE